MGMTDQNFYGQQHMQYYTPGQMPSRQNIHYYQPQVAMSPPSAGYYYSQVGQYPGQGHAMMGQMGGQFGSQGSGGVDPRYGNSMVENHRPVSGAQPRPPVGRKFRPSCTFLHVTR
jgi:hypothetical protein